MIYIMCDRTECAYNNTHNGKFNRCYCKDVTIIDSSRCNVLDKDIPIEDLDLSIRQYNCLKKANINTDKELREHTKETLLKVRNLSERNIDDLIEKGYVIKTK